MARTLYAGRTGDTVLSRMLMGDGRIVVGVPASAGGTPAATILTVWDEPDGIMLTDLLAADGVTPITELVVPAGEIQIPAFYGPDGVTGDLWLKDPDGDYSRLDIGPTGAAGAAGLVWRGTWAAGTAYAVNDAVFYNGSSYRRLVAGTTATAPSADATNWTLVAQKGTDGTGTGDVVGPASSVNNRIAVFSGTTGKLIADGGSTIASLAPLASPTFTGDPKAPTPAASDDDTSIATTAHVKDAIQGGSVIALGTTGGAISLSSSLTAATAVNATVTITLNANTTFTAATMPTVAAGTQFVMRITQDATGSRTLTLTNILKPGGALTLSTAAGAVDLVVFYYDGTSWYASLSGKAFAA